jgi:hypothetical protein
MSILVPYADSLGEQYEILFLRTTLFGPGCDIAQTETQHRYRVLAPKFLIQYSPKWSEIQRVLILKSLHAEFIEFLTELKPDLVVVGQDGNGIGHWTTVLANSLEIPTLACQEGCRGINRAWVGPHEYPVLVSLKIFFFGFLTSLVYRPACFKEDIDDCFTARYAAIWGTFVKGDLERRGKRKNDVFVVGDPRQSAVQPDSGSASKEYGERPLVFFDVATYSFPQGGGNYQRFVEFRRSLIQSSEKLGHKLIYKPHPFTRENELSDIKALVGKNTTLVTSGLGEEIVAQALACITFPSTIMFTILALKVPLIQIHLKARGYGKILWDPEKLHDSAVTIRTGMELESALKKIASPSWIERYRASCCSAAEEMVGPLDGNASLRFASALKWITTSKPSISSKG